MESKVVFFLLSALFLYLAGVLTGTYLGSKTALDITFPLKSKTAELEKKMELLEERLGEVTGTIIIMQMLQDRNVACKIADELLNPILNEITGMVSMLPPRLEEANVPERVENRYTTLNVRAFAIASYIYKNCGNHRLPVLYIYEHGNVKAGLVVDQLKEKYPISVFVAWKGSSDPLVKAINPHSPSLYVCGDMVDVNRAEEVLKQCLS